MIAIKDDGKNSLKSDTAVALGNFDGIHLGHKFLLEKMLNYSAKADLISTVCTFFPHPYKFYNVKQPSICTYEQKLEILEKLGVQLCFLVDFNENFSKLSASEFFNSYLLNRLKAKAIFVGEDFRFGHNREGTVEMLKKLCEEANIELISVPQQKVDNEIISSTAVRTLVQKGELLKAAKFLGRFYSCVGKVIDGNKLGRTIGYPTANIDLESELTPPDGIYSGYTFIDCKRYPAMIYLGTRPTFTNETLRKFEAHVIGYKDDLYGEKMEFFIKKFIRSDKKFENIEYLKEQLDKDKEDILADYAE